MRRFVTHHANSARLTGALLLGALLAAAPASFAQGQTKIGVVDLDRVLAESEAGKALQSRLEEFSASVQTEGESKAQGALEIRQQIADGSATLPEEKLAELQREYETIAGEIRQFRDAKQREGQEMRQQGLGEIEGQLQPIFESIRDEGGYDLILNYAPGVVVALSDRIDITTQVIDRLNRASEE